MSYIHNTSCNSNLQFFRCSVKVSRSKEPISSPWKVFHNFLWMCWNMLFNFSYIWICILDCESTLIIKEFLRRITQLDFLLSGFSVPIKLEPSSFRIILYLVRLFTCYALDLLEVCCLSKSSCFCVYPKLLILDKERKQQLINVINYICGHRLNFVTSIGLHL